MEITLSTAAIGHITIKTTSKTQYNKNGRTKMITLLIGKSHDGGVAEI
jgi:hypothetical protein